MKLLRLLPVLVLLLSSCDPFYINRPREEEPPATIEGYAPMYDTGGSARLIRADPPRDIEQGGKIYLKGSTLYQVETGKGIHVISLADPAAPAKLKFIEVLGCQELSIKDNYLYTNNLNDLVVVDISDLDNPQLKDRITDAFHIINRSRPPVEGWFECPDGGKGDIIGWEKKTLHYPQCR